MHRSENAMQVDHEMRKVTCLQEIGGMAAVKPIATKLHGGLLGDALRGLQSDSEMPPRVGGSQGYPDKSKIRSIIPVLSAARINA